MHIKLQNLTYRDHCQFSETRPSKITQNPKGSQNGQITINQKLYIACKLVQGIQGTGTHKGSVFAAPSG